MKLSSGTKYYLLPKCFNTAGIILLIPAVVLSMIRFYWGIKLDFFNFKVFTFYSNYVGPKYFQLIDNHFSEEIAGILLLLALLFIAFSKEKDEQIDYQNIRAKSFVISFWINSLFILFSFLFLFGFGFIRILILNIYTPLILFIIVFRVLLYRHNSSQLITDEGAARDN